MGTPPSMTGQYVLSSGGMKGAPIPTHSLCSGGRVTAKGGWSNVSPRNPKIIPFQSQLCSERAHTQGPPRVVGTLCPCLALCGAKGSCLVHRTGVSSPDLTPGPETPRTGDVLGRVMTAPDMARAGGVPRMIPVPSSQQKENQVRNCELAGSCWPRTRIFGMGDKVSTKIKVLRDGLGQAPPRCFTAPSGPVLHEVRCDHLHF